MLSARYTYPSSEEVDIYQDQNQNGDRALRTQLTYDGLGRLYQISNPVRLGDTPNYTTYTYDALGRTLTVTTPDGAVAQNSYSSSATDDFTTATDQAGHVMQYGYNGFGQLANVVEDPPPKDSTDSS